MGSSSSFASGARRQAAHILSQPPFSSKPSHVPDPLAGVLATLGRWLTDAIGKPTAWLWDHLYNPIHGVFGSSTGLVLAVAAVALGLGAGYLLVRRRTRRGSTDTTDTIERPQQEDAAALEEAASRAEGAGDLEAAVRLRFRAGLARLEAAGIIASRLVTTTDQVRRTLQSAAFDRLAERHEAVAYAGRSVSSEDAREAREDWPRVIDEARRAPERHRAEP